jgi:galactokinase
VDRELPRMKNSKLFALREELELACDKLARSVGPVDSVREVMDRRYDHITQRLDMLTQEIRDLRRMVQEDRRPAERVVIYPEKRNLSAKSKH